MCLEVTKTPALRIDQKKAKEFMNKVITSPVSVYMVDGVKAKMNLKECPLDHSRDIEETTIRIITSENAIKDVSGYYCTKCGISFVHSTSLSGFSKKNKKLIKHVSMKIIEDKPSQKLVKKEPSKIKRAVSLLYKNVTLMEELTQMECPYDKKELIPYDEVTIFFEDNSKVVLPGCRCSQCNRVYIEKRDMDRYKCTTEQIVELLSTKAYAEQKLNNSVVENSIKEEVTVKKDTNTEYPIISPSQIRIVHQDTNIFRCEFDDTDLQWCDNITIVTLSDQIIIQGYKCPNCRNIYITKEAFQKILENHQNEFMVSSLNEKQDLQVVAMVDKFRKQNQRVEDELMIQELEAIKPEGLSKVDNKEETYEFIVPSKERKSVSEILDYVEFYETIKENYQPDYPFSLLHYAFIYRRFDEVNRILLSLSNDQVGEVLHYEGVKGYSKITPLVCAKWNLHYIYAYDEKHGTKIIEALEPYLEEVESIDLVMEYDSEVWEGKNVYQIFFNGRQPMLDVFYIKRQELASRQLKNNRISLVMDEVGTGKTVSALYSVKDDINEAISQKRKARILIVCPYNKREDWQSDVRRQLGRFAHVVDQGDIGDIYSNDIKKVHFRRDEHYIFICGQIQGKKDSNGSHSALKRTLEQWNSKDIWDLVIIDEVHISFNNFHNIRAKRAMLLSATPIVVTANECRRFSSYIQLLGKITNQQLIKQQIDPIIKAIPDKNDIYVNWFREDMGKSSAVRKIKLYQRFIVQDDIIDYNKLTQEYIAIPAVANVYASISEVEYENQKRLMRVLNLFPAVRNFDEAQNLSTNEYELLDGVNNHPVYNLYGDVMQHVENEKGISDWREIPFFERLNVYPLEQNYRNAFQITEYCKKRFGIRMQSVSLPGKEVCEYVQENTDLFRVLESVYRNKDSLYRMVVILPNGYSLKKNVLKGLMQSSNIINKRNRKFDKDKINVMNVCDVKGLEFEVVIVVDTMDLTENERYIAFTRALDELHVYRCGRELLVSE